MKKIAARLVVLCLVLTLLICSTLSVSATTYVKNVVSDFTTAADCDFLAPGDLNADGKVDAADSVKLRQLLISDLGDGSYNTVFAAKGEVSKYSDTNGDDFVNLKDLLRQKKNLAENFEFISDEAMSINGNSAYNGEFISVLGTGASYKISYSYKSDTPVKVRINGLGEQIVYEDAAATKITSVIHTFKTPLSIDETAGIELQIIGVATVKDFTVTRINMDNELVENW